MSSYYSFANSSRHLVHSERFFAKSEISVSSIMNRIYLVIFLFLLLFVDIDLFSYNYFCIYIGASSISDYFISCFSYDLCSVFFLLYALYFIMSHSLEYLLKYFDIFFKKIFDYNGKISYSLCLELASPFLYGLLKKMWHVVLQCVIFFICLYVAWYFLCMFFYNCEFYVLYKTFLVEFTHGSLNKGYTYYTTLCRILNNSRFYDVYGYFPYSPYTFCGFSFMYSMLLYLYLFKDIFYICIVFCVYIVFVQFDLKISSSLFSFFSSLYMRCVSICISFIYFRSYARHFALSLLVYFFLLFFYFFLSCDIFIIIMRMYSFLLFNCHNLLNDCDVLCNVYRLFDLASFDYVDIFGNRNISTKDHLFWGCFEHIKYCCPIQFVNTYFLQFLGPSLFDADVCSREYVGISYHLFNSVKSSLLLFHNDVNFGYDSVLFDEKRYPVIITPDFTRIDLFNFNSFFNIHGDFSGYFYFDNGYVISIIRSAISWNMYEAFNELIYDSNYIPVIKCFNLDPMLDKFIKDLVNVRYDLFFVSAVLFSKKNKDEGFVSSFRSWIAGLPLKNFRDLFYIDRIACDYMLEEERICRSAVDLRFLFEYIDTFRNDEEGYFVGILHFVFCNNKKMIKDLCEHEKNRIEHTEKRSTKNMLKLLKVEREILRIKYSYGECCRNKMSEIVRAIYVGDFLSDGYPKYTDEVLFVKLYKLVDDYLKDCRSLESYCRDFSELTEKVLNVKSLSEEEKAFLGKMMSMYFTRISFVIASNFLEAGDEEGLYEYMFRIFNIVFIRPVYYYFKYICLFNENLFQHRMGLGDHGLLRRSHLFYYIYGNEAFSYKSIFTRIYLNVKKYLKKLPVSTIHSIKMSETEKYYNLFDVFYPFSPEEVRLKISKYIIKDESKSLLYYIRLMCRSLSWVLYVDCDLNLYSFIEKSKNSLVNYNFGTFFRSFLGKNIDSYILCSRRNITNYTSLFSGHKYLVQETLNELIPKLKEEFGKEIDDKPFMFLVNSFTVYIYHKRLQDIKKEIKSEKVLSDAQYFNKYCDHFDTMTNEYLMEQLKEFVPFLKEKEVIDMYLFFNMLSVTRGD